MILKPSMYRDRGNSRDPCSQLSRSVAIIVPQHTTEPLAAFDVANNLTHFVSRFDDLIVEPLMVSLAMIVLEKCGNSSPCCASAHSGLFARELATFTVRESEIRRDFSRISSGKP